MQRGQLQLLEGAAVWVMIKTLDAARLPRDANVVKASYGQATVLPDIDKIPLFPSHEDVSMCSKPVAPERAQDVTNARL